ncbi:MAG TPA: response regulator [Kofleriaceae bacterium]|jgi:CheY-like chemotaxis protein
MRVLIVDDFPDTAETAGELLRNAGHDCQCAMCGAEALLAVEDFVPDIAILDIALPDISGYELLGALCRRLAQRPPYLVAMTASVEAFLHARDAGFDHCILKPAGRLELLRAIALAEKKHARSSLADRST